MKDGAIVCNSGHFNVELDLGGLDELSREKRTVRPFLEEFKLLDGRRVYLLAEGRLVNLSAAEGHPASVMDMSFANQALAAELLAKRDPELPVGVHTIPEALDHQVATLKLESLGISMEVLTAEQIKYLNSWEEGT
jgi:adenosylhomocysteinase